MHPPSRSPLRRAKEGRQRKAAKPYEFGVKVSLTTTNRRCNGGHSGSLCSPAFGFIHYAEALPGNPYDGHTLGQVIEETQASTGREIERAYLDNSYQGHDAPKPLEGLQVQPEARRPRPDHEGSAPAIGHRGRHRTLRDRRPSRAKLSQGPPGRPE